MTERCKHGKLRLCSLCAQEDKDHDSAMAAQQGAALSDADIDELSLKNEFWFDDFPSNFRFVAFARAVIAADRRLTAEQVGAAEELRNAEATLEGWNRRALGDRNNDYSQLIEASERRVQKARAALTTQPQAAEPAAPKPPFDPLVRARTLLSYLWRKYDAGGTSMGRSHEAVLLETAMSLLGDPPVNELVDNYGEQVGEARDYLSAQRAYALGFRTPTAPTEPT